ncbi:MAG: 16S rRNA (guanine(527)-N(7))-methyltransferase RsmG, partial [bacterium]
MKHSPQTAARLAAYRDLLLRWNTRINLISAETAAEIDQRHIADCAHLQPLVPPEGPIADIGSGAGLPGIVLAIMQPDR